MTKELIAIIEGREMGRVARDNRGNCIHLRRTERAERIVLRESQRWHEI